MPQAPQFDPNEFAPAFDPEEFNQPSKPFDPNTASDLERQVLGLPPKGPEWYEPDYWAPTALRVVPSIVGGVMGGTAGSVVPGAGTLGGMALGGGAGSLVGDVLGQGYEYLRGQREEFNPWEAGVETMLGAVPGFGKAPGLGATGKELLKYAGRQAAEGGFLGAAGTIPQQWAQTGELPSLGQAIAGGGIGAAFGGTVGGGMGYYGSRGATPEHLPVRPPETMDLPLRQPAAPIEPQADLPLQQRAAPPFDPPAAPGSPAAKLEAKSTQPEAISTTLRAEPEVAPPFNPNEYKAPIPTGPSGRILGKDLGDELNWIAEQQAIGNAAGAMPVRPPEVAQMAPPTEAGIPSFGLKKRVPFAGGAREIEFVNPETGVIVPASQAKPGDIPNIPEAAPIPQAATPQAPVEQPLTPGPGASFEDWVKNLIKGESGEFDPDALRRRARGEEPTGDYDFEAPDERPGRRVNPEVVSRENRQMVDNLPGDALRSFIQRHSVNPNYTEFPAGRDLLNYARDVEDARIANPDLYRDVHDLALNLLTDEQASNAIRYYESRGRTDLVDYLTERYQRVRTAGPRGWESVSTSTGEMLPETPPRRYSWEESGKTLEEVEGVKKRGALERLGKLLGEGRTEQLTKGEKEIQYSAEPLRSRGKKKLPDYTIKNWARWGDEQVDAYEVNPHRPGIDVETPPRSSYWPKEFKIIYRDEQGNPIGVLKTDLEGRGISTLAVKSTIGLRRGKVAFEMLREAFDRGVNEPSGITSDLTKNLIQRVKRLIEKGKSESGEFDLDALYTNINKLIDDVSSSPAGQMFGEFIRGESGEGDPAAAMARLRELFQKQGTSGLSPEELAEATKLARESQTTAPEQPKTPPPQPKGRVAQFSQRVPLAGEAGTELDPAILAELSKQKGNRSVGQYLQGGEPQISTGPLDPTNQSMPPQVSALAQRLDEAIQKAGTPNAAKPEDISKLLKDMEDALEVMPEGPYKDGMIRKVLGVNKALLTSWDFSAPGRQGKAFIFNKAWWTSLDDMVRAWGSEQGAKLVRDSITDHPSGYFIQPMTETGKLGKSFAQKVGLDLASNEEMFRSAFPTFEKWTGIAKSSRAHTAFLSKLRSDQFVSMMEAAKRAGFDPEGKDLHLAKTYAEFINNATGRGSLNIGGRQGWPLERSTRALNDVFFAPKNMSGQIRTWNAVLNPYNYYKYDSVMRKQALKSLLAIAGVGLGVGELARMAGAKVSNDPTSSEFRKIRIGKVVLDQFGGYQQFPVGAMKLLSAVGNQMEGAGKRTPFDVKTGKDIAETFFANRLSPIGSFVWSFLDNKMFDGKPFSLKRQLYENTLPIVQKDLLELIQEDPFLAGMISPLNISGFVGSQVYKPRPVNRNR